MLRNEKLRIEIIQLYHDTPVTEYGEKQKTTELVMRNYWWLGITKYIGKYIKGCNIC